MGINRERELITIIEPAGGYTLDWQNVNSDSSVTDSEWPKRRILTEGNIWTMLGWNAPGTG